MTCLPFYPYTLTRPQMLATAKRKSLWLAMHMPRGAQDCQCSSPTSGASRWVDSLPPALFLHNCRLCSPEKDWVFMQAHPSVIFLFKHTYTPKVTITFSQFRTPYLHAQVHCQRCIIIWDTYLPPVTTRNLINYKILRKLVASGKYKIMLTLNQSPFLEDKPILGTVKEILCFTSQLDKNTNSFVTM